MPEPITWDTALRRLEANYERLQHRRDEDLPPLPPELTRGVVGSVLDPVAVHPVEILGPAPPSPAEQLAKLQDQLAARLPDPEPTDDPVLARLRDWRPDRGT